MIKKFMILIFCFTSAFVMAAGELPDENTIECGAPGKGNPITQEDEKTPDAFPGQSPASTGDTSDGSNR